MTGSNCQVTSLLLTPVWDTHLKGLMILKSPYIANTLQAQGIEPESIGRPVRGLHTHHP